MCVPTYSPSVRQGNWNEDLKLEEDALRDFLEKKDKGELLIQKSSNLREVMLKKLEISISRDGYVHFGDSVILINVPMDDSRAMSALSINLNNEEPDGTSGLSSSSSTQPCARNVFIITSTDGSADGDPLRFDQPFVLRAKSTGLYLFSDMATFNVAATMSRHNRCLLVSKGSHLTEWKVILRNPKFRMELEHTPVPANQKVIISHVKTNKNLHLEPDYTLRTPFGREFEISGHTDLDSHRAEKDTQHWVITEEVPGDTFNPVKSPEERE